MALIGAPRKPISRSEAGQRFERGERLPPDWNQLRVTDQFLPAHAQGAPPGFEAFEIRLIAGLCRRAHGLRCRG